MTPEEVKQEALKLTKVFQTPSPHFCINNTPLEHFTKNTLRQRLNTRPSDSQVTGNVMVAGDASHPSSPDLGQGGCMALEDGIILTRKLHHALVLDKSVSHEDQSPDAKSTCESERIHKALLDFHAEAWEDICSHKTSGDGETRLELPQLSCSGCSFPRLLKPYFV